MFSKNTDPSIQKQMDELYKLKWQFYDQRRERNKDLISDARAEHLTEELIKAANQLNKENPLTFSGMVECDHSREGLVCCADWHYGMITDNLWNHYNVDTCKRRIREFVNKVKTYISLNRISQLHIVFLGDACHGSIHTTCRVASEEDTCDQLMHVAELMAQMVEELSKYVNHVKVYSCYGNHMRTIQNKNDSIHTDNLEKIIPWWMRQRLKLNEKVEIIDSEFEEFVKLDICGYKVCAVHGDLDNFKDLGVTVNTIFTRLYGESIDYTISADKHHLEEFESFNIESILVRSLCGTDDHAHSKRLYSHPGQTFIVFNKTDGRECTYHIKLD